MSSHSGFCGCEPGPFGILFRCRPCRRLIVGRWLCRLGFHKWAGMTSCQCLRPTCDRFDFPVMARTHHAPGCLLEGVPQRHRCPECGRVPAGSEP
jgi:hypothetical protein